MEKGEIINIISESYAPLCLECKTKLSNCSNILSLRKHTTLVKEGQYSDKTFYIISGCARAYYLKDGKDISDWFAFENDFISSINSFFLSIPSPHFIETLEDTVILEMSRKTVEELSDEFHDFERLSKVIVTKTMLQQQQRIVSMQFHSAVQKYKNFITLRPDITHRIPLTHIASYLGITLETLSRIRKQI